MHTTSSTFPSPRRYLPRAFPRDSPFIHFIAFTTLQFGLRYTPVFTHVPQLLLVCCWLFTTAHVRLPFRLPVHTFALRGVALPDVVTPPHAHATFYHARVTFTCPFARTVPPHALLRAPFVVLPFAHTFRCGMRVFVLRFYVRWFTLCGVHTCRLVTVAVPPLVLPFYLPLLHVPSAVLFILLKTQQFITRWFVTVSDYTTVYCRYRATALLYHPTAPHTFLFVAVMPFV